MTEASYSIGLIVEALADSRTATALIDRCLDEGIDWLDGEQLDDLRAWRGIEPGTDHTKWSVIQALARKHRVDPRGRFGGEPGKPDARAARRALLLFAKLGMRDFVVLIRDDGGKPERREGLEQARNGTAHPNLVVLGVAHPEREAWVIAGFMAGDARERDVVAAERQRLGFDPTHKPHELRGNGKRSAKVALANLLGTDPDREHRCLTEPPLAELRQRGTKTGLAAFLEEIDDRIVPVISGASRSPR